MCIFGVLLQYNILYIYYQNVKCDSIVIRKDDKLMGLLVLWAVKVDCLKLSKSPTSEKCISKFILKYG